MDKKDRERGKFGIARVCSAWRCHRIEQKERSFEDWFLFEDDLLAFVSGSKSGQKSLVVHQIMFQQLYVFLVFAHNLQLCV